MSTHISILNVLAKNFKHLDPTFLSELKHFLESANDLVAWDPETTDFATVELSAVAHVRKLGLDLMRTCIEKQDAGDSSITSDGRSFYRLPSSRGSVMTLLGQVDYTRSRYRGRGKKNSLCPVDETLGLLEGRMTRPAGQLAMSLISELPLRQCQEFLHEAGGMMPSVSTLQRLLQETHWAWQNIEEDAMPVIRAMEDIPKEAKTMAVSLDGAMVRLRPDEQPIGAEGSALSTGSNWREASCGTISFHDQDGTTLKTISSGRMPEKNKLSLKHWLSQELAAVVRKQPDLTVVTIADGAPDNWSYLSHLSSDAEVLDFYHACTHLSKASEYAHAKERWYHNNRHILRNKETGVTRVIGAIRGLRDRAKTATARKELTVILKYFRTHRHRMNYAVLKAKGLPIGSGIVEATNRTHIGERMKRSGMHWGMEGGQAVLSFRSLRKSKRFEQAWKWIVKEIDTRDPDNDNWKQYYEKKAA